MQNPQWLNGSNVMAFPLSGPRAKGSAVAHGKGSRALDCFGLLRGSSQEMLHVYGMIERVAPTSSTVLIVGDSGSGKELAANTIHNMSERSAGPFVAVNCGAIPATLIEAELFGYERGAFTGASRTHRGYFERASGGTLFLDEITEMPTEMQVRLLRVLESGNFYRVGSEQERSTDVRIIAATNRDPAAAVRSSCLRQDLMYRLAVFPIVLPPLRCRGNDAELLAAYFLEALNQEAGTEKVFSAPSHALLRAHTWPGNVRELKNCIERAFLLADETVELQAFTPAAGPSRSADGSLSFPIGTPLAEMEKQTIYAALEHYGGNKRRCAEILGISLKTLYNRLTEYTARLDDERRVAQS